MNREPHRYTAVLYAGPAAEAEVEAAKEATEAEVGSKWCSRGGGGGEWINVTHLEKKLTSIIKNAVWFLLL